MIHNKKKLIIMIAVFDHKENNKLYVIIN